MGIFFVASHHNLTNLTVIIDYNNLQSLQSVDDTLSLNPLDQKLTSFGWQVHTVDGHNHDELIQALVSTTDNSRPLAIIALTVKGKGVSFMENSVEWHYKSPNKSELAMALNEVSLT